MTHINLHNFKKNTSLYLCFSQKLWFKVHRYYAMNFDFFDMEPHEHPEFEIMYIASGTCTISYWDKHTIVEKWNVREGEYIFIDCNIMHQLSIPKGSHCRILNLEINIAHNIENFSVQNLYRTSVSLQNFSNTKLPIYKGYDANGSLHTIITEIHKQLQNPMDVSEKNMMQNLFLSQFIIEIARQYTQKNNQEGGIKYVRMTLTYLNKYFDQEIKIRNIADHIGISSAYLQRLFKEQTGITLIEKINELRINKAKILLETSRLPITDIAISVGFNNRQHFSYTFQKIVKCPPALYRKHRGNHLVWNNETI